MFELNSADYRRWLRLPMPDLFDALADVELLEQRAEIREIILSRHPVIDDVAFNYLLSIVVDEDNGEVREAIACPLKKLGLAELDQNEGRDHAAPED